MNLKKLDFKRCIKKLNKNQYFLSPKGLFSYLKYLIAEGNILIKIF